ncbi:MAG: non-canonical purine NTP pyrophosphatase [Candidatus Saccharibacteria bacterium]|nr:non-canonical purine NTP pyrophosphatase [Candidatus Saccharibacteria bacterium]
MKKILIATTNPGKIMTAKKILAKLGYEGLSFADLNLHLEEPDETMETAEEIAAEKALGYAKQFADFPVLARDDTNTLIGVDEEDDPKNHNKEFVAKRMGEYTDANGEKVFSEVAHKYGGEVPTCFDWGYALAWHENGEIKVVHGLATTGAERAKIVERPSPKTVPGFCFASVMKVLIGDEWKYDTELTEEESWKAYWNIQAETIESLIKQCDLLK